MNIFRNGAFKYQLAATMTCATFLAFVQWFMNRDLFLTPMYLSVFLKYLVLNLLCYLLALFIVRKYWLAGVVPITGFVVTAIVGAVLSAILVDTSFLLSYWGSFQLTTERAGELIQKFIYFVVLNCFLTIPVMVAFYWVGAKTGAFRIPNGGV
jgi:hypothetical protein